VERQRRRAEEEEDASSSEVEDRGDTGDCKSQRCLYVKCCLGDVVNAPGCWAQVPCCSMRYRHAKMTEQKALKEPPAAARVLT
jgi:hypothetical protein